MANIRLLAVDPYFPADIGVLFSLSVDNREVRCAITNEALWDHFGGYSHDLTPAFNRNLNRIMQIAEKLIEENRFENEMIVIKSQDVANFRNR
jgi:hypothetical protein